MPLFSVVGSAIEETAQHRRAGEARNEGHVGVDPLDGEHCLVDVDRVVAVRHDGRLAAHGLERLVRRRGGCPLFIRPPALSLTNVPREARTAGSGPGNDVPS